MTTRALAIAILLPIAGCHSGPSPELQQAAYYCNAGDRFACTAVSVLRSQGALQDAENTFTLLSIGAIGLGAYTATLPGHAVPLYPYYPYYWY